MRRRLYRRQQKDGSISAEPVNFPSRPRAGRPTAEQQALRHEELLDAALDLFLRKGFDGTTVDEISKAVGMSKRTVYALYADKDALFKATVRRGVTHHLSFRQELESAVTDDLERSLTAIAMVRISRVTTDDAMRVQRILNSQAYRFPELVDQAYAVGTGPIVKMLADLFERHRQELAVTNFVEAAHAFLSLVVGGTSRLAMMGKRIGQEETAVLVNFAVKLFLNGARVR